MKKWRNGTMKTGMRTYGQILMKLRNTEHLNSDGSPLLMEAAILSPSEKANYALPEEPFLNQLPCRILLIHLQTHFPPLSLHLDLSVNSSPSSSQKS